MYHYIYTVCYAMYTRNQWSFWNDESFEAAPQVQDKTRKDLRMGRIRELF